MRSSEDIERLVTELDRQTVEKRAKLRDLDGKIIGEKLPNDTGLIQVGVHGNLVDIQLDRRQLPHTNPQRLEQWIVSALNAAEEKAQKVKMALVK